MSGDREITHDAIRPLPAGRAEVAVGTEIVVPGAWRYQRGPDGWYVALGDREIADKPEDRHTSLILDALAEARASLATLRADTDRAQRVHLERHTRLAEAVGMAPGYSADAAVDEAIKRLASQPDARATGQADGSPR